MNLQHALSRRVLLRRGTVAGLALAGTTASATLVSRMVLAQTSGTRYVANADGIRVRDTPSLAGAIVAVIATGDEVTFRGESTDADGYTWLNVTVVDSSLTGWAASDFLDVVETTFAAGASVKVNDDGVNLRSGPGTANGVIATYDAGTTATVVRGPTLATGHQWYEIDVADGSRGWMAAEFLTGGPGGEGWVAGTKVHVTSDDVNLRNAPRMGGTVIATFDTNMNAGVVGGPQTADGHDWYKIGIASGDGVSGWMAADFLAEGHVGVDDTWAAGSDVVTTTDVNLRSGPGTGNSVIGVYAAGEVATVLRGPTVATGYSWYEVELVSDGATGWFADAFLEGARVEPTGSRLRVVDGPLNVRESSDTSAAIITTVPTGGIVVVADASGTTNDGYTWRLVYVEVNPDLAGWIATDFTEPA